MIFAASLPPLVARACAMARSDTFDVKPLICEVPMLAAMRGAIQDPVHHAEGDVAIHTRLVFEALTRLEAYWGLSDTERMALALAALFHDVGKPSTTQRAETGRVHHPGHARRGERMARRQLWSWGVPLELRELICGMIRYHEVPFHAIDQEQPERVAIRASMSTRCDLLALLARADSAGRTCATSRALHDNTELFVALCEELDCLRQPFAFSTAHARFMYFRRTDASPRADTWDDTSFEVVILSGLPGAGKDTWLHENKVELPVISLDSLRDELDVNPADRQGTVVQAAKSRAREMLRNKQAFVWNATNVTRQLRRGLVDLAVQYGARVKIVYVESPAAALRTQNRLRDRTVPDAVIDRLLQRWDVPDSTEAHEVVVVDRANVR